MAPHKRLKLNRSSGSAEKQVHLKPNASRNSLAYSKTKSIPAALDPLTILKPSGSSDSNLENLKSPKLGQTKHSFCSVSQKCISSPRNTPRAVGFLSMVESSPMERNEQDKMLYDFNILLFLFPGFPKAMMKALIVREEGNMRAVAEYLKLKGWGQTTKVDLISTISNSTSLHFKIPYFWGKFKRNHLKILSKYDSGYYFTCFAYPNNYYLCCVNTSGETTKVPLESPKIPKLYEQLFSLTHPITRPDSISIHDLVFLDNV